MVLRLHAVAGSRQGFSWSRQSYFSSVFLSQQGFKWCRYSVFFSVVTMSLPRQPMQEVRVATRSLVKAKRFRVVTEICSVAIGFHGVVLRQGILCRNIVWPRSKGLVSRHSILCHDRVG